MTLTITPPPHVSSPPTAHLRAAFDPRLRRHRGAAARIALVPTGLVIAVPAGHFLGIFARSSTPLKRGLIVANGVGVLDSDYCVCRRSEDPVLNVTDAPVHVVAGDVSPGNSGGAAGHLSRRRRPAVAKLGQHR
jgi:hypothetical protein